MIHNRFSNIATVIYFGLFFLNPSFSTGQDASTTDATLAMESVSETTAPLEIKLSVNEVRLDVVVLDKKGNPVTDLTADDFEVYQDNKRQKILASVYIDSLPATVAQPAADKKELSNMPLQPATALKKEDVRRTILFVIDDFAMNFENLHHTKTALRNFVEKQMQQGDMVAILRTDYGNSALNMFYSDKRETLARINAIPPLKYSTKEWEIGFSGSSLEFLENFLRKFFENQISTLTYGIRAAKNMPGRKIIMMMSPTLVFSNSEKFLVDLEVMLYKRGMGQGLQHYLHQFLQQYSDMYDKLADEALRAGVIVNFLDMDGLYTFGTNKLSVGDRGELIRETGNWRDAQLILKAMELVPKQLPAAVAPNSLPEKTGGVVIQNSNFFFDGLGKETEGQLRGYYLISYAPPPDTFKGRGNRADYRRLRVTVKRKDTVVYTRDGFFGRLESETDADTSKLEPLIKAIYSPFKSTDINVDIAAGYVKDTKDGYLVRSWIHLEPREVKIIETEAGNRINLDAVYVASDINGNIQASKRAEFSLSGFNADWVQKHGIRFSMLLPVKKPGSYYIRFSVQDKESGNIGSAYQFLEIPDLKKKGLVLSNVFMITSAEDLEWMYSKETAELFSPVFQGEEVRSPALRTYRPGDNLQILTMLYNADIKAITGSEIEIQTIWYKDGQEFNRGEPAPVTLPDAMKNAKIADVIPITQRFALGTKMQAGYYTLEFVVTDKKNNKGNEGVAFQTLSFKVVENQTCETGGNVCSE